MRPLRPTRLAQHFPDSIRQSKKFGLTKRKIKRMDGSEDDTLGSVTLDITFLKRKVKVTSNSTVEDITAAIRCF